MRAVLPTATSSGKHRPSTSSSAPIRRRGVHMCAYAVRCIIGSRASAGASQLRALAEYYACDDAKKVFVDDFVAAWAKVAHNCAVCV